MTEHYEIWPIDCREAMRCMAPDSIDSVCTDPPYELSFMARKWDGSGVAFDPATWREVYRVLKPGGHLLAFSGSRTYHRMVCAIEDAGFEIRDQIMWLYGSGFPKSHDVSKGIDKKLGDVGSFGAPKSAAHAGWIDRGRMRGEEGHEGYQRPWMKDEEAVDRAARQYLSGSAEARQWQGWGTALKPAHEPIVVARKPLIGTVAENVLRYGTGALSIDASRVAWASDTERAEVNARTAPNSRHLPENSNGVTEWGSGRVRALDDITSAGGRWPANVIHDGSDEVLAGFPQTGASGTYTRGSDDQNDTQCIKKKVGQSHVGYNDPGSAARFFYCAKASKADRNSGCEGLPEGRAGSLNMRTDGHAERSGATTAPTANTHPTVKPTELMRYLCRLVTSPGGRVLDPFAGSGSTGKAAIAEGFYPVLCEMTDEYLPILQARLEHAVRERGK